MKGLILNSGGIDSPVAAYLMAQKLTAAEYENIHENRDKNKDKDKYENKYEYEKRPEFIAVHFDNQPYTGNTTHRAQETTEKLNELLKPREKIPIISVPHGDILSQFLRVCGKEEKKYTCIFCKRMMYRVAEVIAHHTHCSFLVTGENLGQVASQTLHNIYVTSRAVALPIIRPLIGLDKLDIIAVAEKIGTYNISTKEAYHCDAVPKYPIIKANLKRIEAIENKIDYESLIERTVQPLREC